MTESNKEVSNSKTFDIDTATKLIAFFATVLYIVGFFTTNLYLKQFDFSDFLLIKPRFIFTGAWLVFTIILSRLFFEFGFHVVSKEFSNIFIRNNFTIRQVTSLFRSIILILMSTFIMSSPFIIIFSLLYEKNEFLKIVNSGLEAVWLYSFILILGWLPTMFWKEHIIFSSPLTRLRLDKQDYRTVFIILLSSAYIYTVTFAQEIYPKIPEQFGGGEPRQVRILFAKDQADTIKQMGIPTCSSGKLSSNWSKPVSLLFEGSERYLLRLNNTKLPIPLKKTTGIDVQPIPKLYNPKQKLTDCPSYLTN